MTNPNGVVLWRGPSQLDGSPIAVIATGLKQGSTNSKTGAMVQVYILRTDMPPQEAINTGADEAICGDCTHRGDGTGKQRSCYVVVFQGPRGVYNAYQRGSYADGTPELVRGRSVRFGAYGDPAAAPAWLWRQLADACSTFTSYTHQWRDLDPTVWAPLAMASADNVDDALEAQAAGWRTFRVGTAVAKGLDILCPASEEAGRKTTCADCRACGGTSAKAKVSIFIPAHGVGRRHAEANAAG